MKGQRIGLKPRGRRVGNYGELYHTPRMQDSVLVQENAKEWSKNLIVGDAIVCLCVGSQWMDECGVRLKRSVNRLIVLYVSERARSGWKAHGERDRYDRCRS